MKMIEDNRHDLKLDIVSIAKKIAGFCSNKNTVAMRSNIRSLQRGGEGEFDDWRDGDEHERYIQRQRRRRQEQEQRSRFGRASVMTGANADPLAVRPARSNIGRRGFGFDRDGERGAGRRYHPERGNNGFRDHEDRPRPPPRVKMSIRDLDGVDDDVGGVALSRADERRNSDPEAEQNMPAVRQEFR